MSVEKWKMFCGEKWRPNHQTSTPVKANVKTIPAGVLVCTCHLMKTCVLHVVRRSLLLSFYLHTNLKANGAWHCWLVSSLFCETGNTYRRPLWCRTKHLRLLDHDPSSFVLRWHHWQMKTKEENCGSADHYIWFLCIHEIRKEVLKNIQAHLVYSDLHLREQE